jgi:chromosome segregation protein
MAHIKRMVMSGFKSFAKKTEVDFDRGINIFVGPNGSGKSNVSDALCFVLGRLSIKSMRAAKAKNLIFMGSKIAKPAKEAYVELVFDNRDRTFNIESDEIGLKRVVRRNGGSVYKINEETKTRAEIIEMLAHAGIDPHGFNIVLQGGIDSIIKMHPEDRRKIIEEVAGIAIYEHRKEKSLKELEKAESRLKEISTILRERSAYLNNLEEERKQAQRYKELELTVKRAKASILHRRLGDKEKELGSVRKSVEEKTQEKDKIREKGEALGLELENLGEKINEINKQVQEASGVEQSNLSGEITNLKSELEGLRVRKESLDNRKEEFEKRIEELERGVPDLEEEISDLKEKSPKMAKKNVQLEEKKEELGELESERKRLLKVRAELEGLKSRLKDRREQLGKIKAEGESIVLLIEEQESALRYKSERGCSSGLEEMKKSLSDKKEELEGSDKKERENEKYIVVADNEIANAEKVKKHVSDLDICPLCQSKMTHEHKGHVDSDSDERILGATRKREEAMENLERIQKGKDELVGEILRIEEGINLAGVELMKHKNIAERKEQLGRVVESQKDLEVDIEGLEKKREKDEGSVVDLGKIEERHEAKMHELEDLSARTEENLDATLLYKQQELEKTRSIILRSGEELEGLELSIGDIEDDIVAKEEGLEKKEGQEKELNERFKKMFSERDSLQKNIQDGNLSFSETQNELREIEEQVNYLKVGKAKLDAEAESLKMEIGDYEGVELLKGSIVDLEGRRDRASETLARIGTINLRALEVYDEVKKQYDEVYFKVETLEKEKGEIMRIIEEIDKKKKKTFMRTFRAINELFSSNFSKLYSKGVAYLEIQNKEDIFAGGVDIVVKLAKGKYFDISSLSGGEKTLVALALLFSIQEHKPYHFYIFDEIDAALDKRNSERLAGLLEQYMKGGQYIVITHNDAIIMNSNLLYGVSMQEGVSKILSLKVD